jgi:hypothetical protein
MRKTLFLILAIALTPVKTWALAVPDGKAAILEAVLGKVSLTSNGKDQKPQVGMALAFGDQLNTGANGRVSLRHADNAVTRMAPNTELTLRAPGEKKGIFLALKGGVIRFLVGKRKPGETFEVSTANAVAAVKGTDAGVETDGQSTSSAVYDSDHQDALEVTDSKTGKTEDLSPGETSTLDLDGFNSRELTEQDRLDSDKNFDGLPKPDLNETPQGGQDQGQAPTPVTTPAPEKTAVPETTGQTVESTEESALEKDIQDAFAQAADDVRLDNYLDRDEKTGDLAAGRIVYDRNGDRTQVSAYILRPAPNVVVKDAQSRRDSGPFLGVSEAKETTTWSAALPTNWYDAVKMPLNDPSNLDPKSGYPILYRLTQDFWAKNPVGDKLEIFTTYDPPNYQGYYDPVNLYWTTDPNTPIDPLQTFKRDVYTGPGDIAGQTPVFTLQEIPWTTPDAVNAGRMVTTNPGQGYYNYSWFTAQSVTGDNGIHLDFQPYSGGPTFLSMEFRVMTNDGTQQDLSGMPAGLTQGSFRGLDNSLNLEVTFNAPNFSAPIDILFIPAVFDAMDILDLPTSMQGGG